MQFIVKDMRIHQNFSWIELVLFYSYIFFPSSYGTICSLHELQIMRSSLRNPRLLCIGCNESSWTVPFSLSISTSSYFSLIYLENGHENIDPLLEVFNTCLFKLIPGTPKRKTCKYQLHSIFNTTTSFRNMKPGNIPIRILSAAKEFSTESLMAK